MRVTITGADNAVDPAELVKLSGAYPFVEWGILLSHKRMGTPRYPDTDWIAHLASLAFPAVSLSVHLCGSAARDMIAGKSTWPWPFRQSGSGRIQINGYEGELHPSVTTYGGSETILQVRDASLLHDAAGHALSLRNASILYDPSGGRGEVPEAWPGAPAGVRMGIAGGITPDTVVSVMHRAHHVAASWVDMETGVRDEAGRFDMDKARAVLKAASGWLAGSQVQTW